MTDPNPTPAAVQIKLEARTSIASRAGEVRETIVRRLADAEIERRTEILSKKLGERDALDKQIKSVRAKVVGVNEAGEEIKQFDPADFKARAKNVEKLAKLDRLIGNVIDEPTAETYQKLEKSK